MVQASKYNQNRIISYTGTVTGGFYQTILDKDFDNFKNVLWISMLVVVGSGLSSSTQKFIVEVLAWKWREILCTHLHVNFFI